MAILIDNFSKGWQNRAAHELMQDDALYSCEDFSLDLMGSLRCRSLVVENSYFTGITTTAQIKNLHQLDVEGVGKRLIFYSLGSTLYVWNSETNTATVISTAVGTNRFSYTALKPLLSDSTYVFYTDGVTMAAHNGTTSKTWGIDAPESSVNIALSTISGNLDGVYTYQYTFYDSDTGSESNPSPTCARFTVATGSGIEVTNIGVSSASRITSRKLYRTIDSGGTHYLIATIPDNTTTTFLDTVADSDLSLALTIDQDIPPTASLIASYKDRIFLAGVADHPNRVYFSLPSLPDNYPSTFWITVGTSDDEVRAIVEYDGMLYFVQRAGISRLYGEDANTFKATKTRSHVGTNAKWSVAVGPDGIYFSANDGAYRFDGVKSTRVSESIGRIFDKTPTALYDIVDTTTLEANVKGVFIAGVYYLIMPLKDTTGTTTNRLIRYDAIEQTWLRFNLACDDIFADAGRGELYGASEDLQTSGNYMVYNMFNSQTSSVDSPSPQLVTKSYSVLEALEYTLTDTGITKKTNQPTIGWLRKFRIDADGNWTLVFYLDDVIVYSISLTNLSATTRYLWRNLPDNLKGRNVYVKITADGTIRPDSHIIRALEIR